MANDLRVLRAHKNRTRSMPLWMRAAIGFQVITGGLSGILIGALAVKWIHGDRHPIWLSVREAVGVIAEFIF